MMRRRWTRTVEIQVVEDEFGLDSRTVEVEVQYYAGSPPTLTDPGEPEEVTCTEAHDIERKVDRERLRQAVNELLPKLDKAIEKLEHFTKAPVISLAEERRRQAALANMLAEKDEE